MSTFSEALRDLQADGRLDEPATRTWVFVAYDQLNDALPPMADIPAERLGIVLLENPWKARRRPYHKQKLALVLANMRHFALEQASRGVAVRYEVCDGPYQHGLRKLTQELGPLVMMDPAERELRVDLAPLVDDGLVDVVPHQGWLTTHEQFKQACGPPPWRMDVFYREIRRQTGLLMQGASPEGGQYSHDGANREPWHGDPPAPEPPQFEPDAITLEVGRLIEARFSDHPGQLDLHSLPVTEAHARACWRWARERCMTHFGPYEDAMSTASTTLFHTRLSPLMNNHRLLAERLVRDVAAMDIPLNSKEGFIRQVIGWREFMRHVHLATDGFRRLKDVEVRPESHHAAWWDDPPQGDSPPGLDGGAAPSKLDAHRPLPAAWWGEASGLRCLDHVVEGVLREGYSHHITRLMVLSNIATLLDVEPRDLTDWFWVAYTDAYDWVVEPNVLGMGTFAVGELFTTKPYVSGSNYIAKMSDYCDDCAFNPKRNCPLKRLYWAFLERHHEHLSANQRMRLIYGNLARRSESNKALDRAVFDEVWRALDRGEPMTPARIAALEREEPA